MTDNLLITHRFDKFFSFDKAKLFMLQPIHVHHIVRWGILAVFIVYQVYWGLVKIKRLSLFFIYDSMYILQIKHAIRRPLSIRILPLQAKLYKFVVIYFCCVLRTIQVTMIGSSFVILEGVAIIIIIAFFFALVSS